MFFIYINNSLAVVCRNSMSIEFHALNREKNRLNPIVEYAIPIDDSIFNAIELVARGKILSMEFIYNHVLYRIEAVPAQVFKFDSENASTYYEVWYQKDSTPSQFDIHINSVDELKTTHTLVALVKRDNQVRRFGDVFAAMNGQLASATLTFCDFSETDHESMSIGDAIEWQGYFYICEHDGWSLLEE